MLRAACLQQQRTSADPHFNIHSGLAATRHCRPLSSDVRRMCAFGRRKRPSVCKASSIVVGCPPRRVNWKQAHRIDSFTSVSPRPNSSSGDLEHVVSSCEVNRFAVLEGYCRCRPTEHDRSDDRLLSTWRTTIPGSATYRSPSAFDDDTEPCRRHPGDDKVNAINLLPGHDVFAYRSAQRLLVVRRGGQREMKEEQRYE